MGKTITFNELLKNEDKFYITYAKGGTPKKTTLETPEEVLKFISENVYDINLLSINEVIIDLEKLIEKYSR